MFAGQNVMERSKIEWTDATWNPLRGCSRVSEGCRNGKKAAGRLLDGVLHDEYPE